MASGTGNLPNQGMDAVPFTPITAQWGDEIIENIESLADGSGIGDEAVTTAKINDGAITSSKLGLSPETAEVTTTQTTTSTSYTDLATSGPAATVTIGSNGLAWVHLSATITNNTTNGFSYMGFAVSGASTVAAADAFALEEQFGSANVLLKVGISFLVTGLTAGSNTFTAKYKSGNGSHTANFRARKITVIPL